MDTHGKALALTFDDGPDAAITPQILDILEEYSIPATFFLIGKNITPETVPLVKRALELGCEIENHSYIHHYMDRLTEEEIRDELKRNEEKIYEITGEHTVFFRPPYLAVNKMMYDNIDKIFIGGLHCSDWDEEVSARERSERTVENACDGAVILLHDFENNTKTAEAFKSIVPGILDKGLECVTLKKLFKYKGLDITSRYCRGHIYDIVEKKP